MNKTKIILIDGYTGAGKSTCLGIFKELLGSDFNCVKKYTTRQPRIEEANNGVFYESVFLTPSEFAQRNLDFVLEIEGVYYGVDRKEIKSFFDKKYVFLVANQYHRSQMISNYQQLADIKQILIKTSKGNRIERIEKAKVGEEQAKLRMRKLNANLTRNESDFDFIINNDSTIDELRQQITNLISNKL